MSSNRKRGHFVWYDLMTTDVQGAVDFYGHVAGWGTQPFEADGGPPYLMWTVGETPIGGVAKIDPATMGKMPPSWMVHISSPDVDASVDKIRELGGQIHHGPEDIPTVGRFAIASDPQGAAFSVFEPETEAPGSEEAPRPGEFSWNELATTDHEAAFTFYQKLFGWDHASDFDMGEMGIYKIFGLNGRDVGGMFDKPTEMPGPPAWLFYIHTDDLERALGAVEEHGGQVVNGPMEVPGGDRIAQCLDPQGAFFALHTR